MKESPAFLEGQHFSEMQLARLRGKNTMLSSNAETVKTRSGHVVCQSQALWILALALALIGYLWINC